MGKMDIETTNAGRDDCQQSGDSSLLWKYSQETSFSGLRYIGETGSYLRRLVLHYGTIIVI